MKRPIRIVSNLVIFSGRNLAKTGVEGSIPFARSRFLKEISCLERPFGAVFCFAAQLGETGEQGEGCSAPHGRAICHSQ